MERYILENGVKILYEYRQGNITSFCIGFNAGALEESGYNLGTAHAVEHMIFKGTKNRSEFEINRQTDEVFGFSNAMTNFPYSIYYGTVNSQDFEGGFELYSDIILNPVLPEEGFREEMSVISEELREWREDIQQSTEDYLFFNSFSKRRIKNLIIGQEETLSSITLKELKDFYNRYYVPENCVISIVTSLEIEKAVKIISTYFDGWKKEFIGIEEEKYEDNKAGIYENTITGAMGARICYCFPVHSLNEGDMEILNLFNMILGEGVSSLLYDEIRTKNGYAYEVYSSIKNERGIKVLTIYVSTSVENVDKCLDIINSKLQSLKEKSDFYSQEIINKMHNRIRLKRELAIEKSIELSKKLTTYELMHGRAEKVFEEIKFNLEIKPVDVNRVVNTVMTNPSIQIVK